MVSRILSSNLKTKKITLTSLIVITVVALGLRLYQLGERVFYYDEAWFGYWILKFMENGSWEYFPWLHGPFFVRINPIIFSIFGVNDFTARLFVAILGGLLPLAAWLYRDYLRNGEIIALGILLAFNPILLYYSRFMRKDLPLAAFMFISLGLLIRAYETKRSRYFYGAGISLGLAFGTKESVLLWVLTWIGAGVLVLDRHLLKAAFSNGSVKPYIIQGIQRWITGANRYATQILVSILLFLGVVIFFYAPRAGPYTQLGLWKALGGNWGMIPAVIEAATIGALTKAIEYWAAGSIQKHPYLPYFIDTVKTLLAGAIGIILFAPVGFLYDRYRSNGTRAIVDFNFYSGLAAIIGYPLANNFPVPWSTTHAVIPLTIPAAVGIYTVYQWGTGNITIVNSVDTFHNTDLRLAVTSIIFAIFVVTSGITAIQVNYMAPHESPKGPDGGSEIVYYAQPPGQLHEVIRAIATSVKTSQSNGNRQDVDVLFVGESLAMDESKVQYPPAIGGWFARMPLPWYTEMLHANTKSILSPTEIGKNPPPVIITKQPYRNAIANKLGNEYTSQRYFLDDAGDRTIVVFIRKGLR
ncbi:MAG: flippase activity-associated protein Agl23 [Halobacteriaceae archaeon]